MRIFRDSGIWKKIVIVFLLISVFDFILPEQVQAVGDETGLGGELMGNILALFAGICDGVMTLVHKIFTGTESVVYTITAGTNVWHVVILVGIIVVGIALLAAGWATLPALVVKGALTMVMLTAVGAASITFATTSGILRDWLADETLVLSTFSLTPYEIFSNRDDMLSVNFFEKAKNSDVGATEQYYIIEENVNYNENDIKNKYDITRSEIQSGEHEHEQKKEAGSGGFGAGGSTLANVDYDIYTKQKVVKGKRYKFVLTKRMASVKATGTTTEKITVYEYGISPDTQEALDKAEDRTTMIQALRDVIGNWYVTLRLLALVGMMSVLVYIGIKIMISSAASTKAKYKQLLMDWFVAMLLLFIMHYIMVFLNLAVDKFTEMIGTIRVEAKEEIELEDGTKETVMMTRQDGVECFMIGLTTDSGGELKVDDDSKELVREAYNALVGDDESGNNKFKNFFYKDPKTLATGKNDANILMWPAENFTVQARIKAQLVKNANGITYTYIGYTLVYIMLVVYTIVFLVVYIKRLVYMAFLTMISPLVALSYPIDKIKDGSAQGFNFWFKEYLFNLLLQPLHLLLYMLLIGSAMELASSNVVYVIVALGFMVPAEKLVKQMFGFKGNTPGSMPGVAAGAMMMNFTRNMFNRNPKRAPSEGKNGGSSGDDASTTRIKNYNPYANSSMYNGLPPTPPSGGGGGGGNPPTPPSGGGGGGNPPNPPSGGGGGGNPPNPPQGGGGGNPPNLPLGGGGGGNPPTPPSGGGGGGNPPNPPSGGGGGNPPNLPLGGGGGGNPPNPSSGGSGGTPTIPPTGQSGGNQQSQRGTRNGQQPPSRGRRIANAMGAAAKGTGRRFVRRNVAAIPGALQDGLGMVTGGLGAMAGIAAGGIAGIATGDASKGFEYMTLGAASGYKLGHNISDNVVTGVMDGGSYAIDAARGGYYAGDPEGLRESNMKRESRKWRNNEQNIRKLQNNLTRDQYNALMQKDSNGNRAIDQYIYQGFTDANDIIAAEKFMATNSSWTRKDAIDTLALQKQVGKIDDMKLDDQIKWENTMAKEFAAAMGIDDVNDDAVKANVQLARQNLKNFEAQRDYIV